MLQDAVRAFHNDLGKLKKYLKPLHLGAVQDIQNRSIDEDFRRPLIIEAQWAEPVSFSCFEKT
jgi:hypothetical protein